MRMSALVMVVGGFFLTVPAWATCDDTHPLDCIQILDPNLQKEVATVGFPQCGSGGGEFWLLRPSGQAVDIQGAGSGFDAAGNFYSFSPGGDSIYRDGRDGHRETIATSPGPGRTMYGINVDAINGRIYVAIAWGCWGHAWIVAMTGLPTLLDLIQTYTPTKDAVVFRAPLIPEGLRPPVHYDTYWGRVSDLPDFTRAQPMKCSFPATTPQVGDYLTVPDTSPRPAPGQVNYVVTAVTNGTQRRYGRKRISGVLSGRDPALLPSCP